jgi:hypothetical protein
LRKNDAVKTPSIQTAIELYREQRARIYAVDPHEAIRNARGAQQTARDHMSRLMYELLQNTDDAHATHVRIVVDRGSQTLFFADDGDGIAPQAVESLSGLFFSGKTSGIGRKGIGFKAVYSLCDNPIVISGTDAIIFDRSRALNWMTRRGLDPTYVPHQWLPFHSTRSDLEAEYPTLVTLRDFSTIVVLPLRQADALKRVFQDLASFDARTLLAFRCVRQLAIVSGGEGDYALELTGDRRASGICTLQDTRAPSPSWWRLQWTTWTAPAESLESLEVEERDRAQITDVLIGVQVDEKLLHPLEPADPPPLFVYYPTRHIAPSKFLTHADFAVTSDRTQIADPSQHAYNACLSGCVAQATVAFCNTLVEQGHDRIALRLLAPDARRDGTQERTLREALLQRTRLELILRSLAAKSLCVADCIGLEAEDTTGFLRIGSRTGIFDRLPTEGILGDELALSTLTDLGVRSLLDLDLLMVIDALLRRTPAAGPWVIALWSWLARTEDSLVGETRDAWERQVVGLPFLPTTNGWVSPGSLANAPFFLGRLPHRPNGVCLIHECHPEVMKTLTQSPDQEALVEFLKNHDADDDAVHAQLVGLDKATRAHRSSDSGGEAGRFLRAIEMWDLLNVPRPRELLSECPVPVLSQGIRAWSPAWKVYLADGTDGRHLRRVYRDNPNVAWIDRERLLSLNLRPEVVEWLGCPSRPEVVQMTDDASREREQQRVRLALAVRGIGYSSLDQTAPPKELLKLSPNELSEQQRESLLVFLARYWEEVYQGHARKSVYYFYWSRRSTTIDEAWWEQLQALPFDTGRFPETVALIDCRLALDDEVRALEPFVVQPALRSLRREERTLVLKWLGHALGRAVRLAALTWSEWTRLLGEAIPKYWGRRANDRGAPTRIRDAYRLFFKWHERFGRSAPGSQRQRWLLCEGSGGLGIVDTQAHTVYVDDDLDVRAPSDNTFIL